jgi:hypothetical protein
MKIGLLLLAFGVAAYLKYYYGLEEWRGGEAGKLAVRGGVGHGQGSGVGVDRGLIELLCF